MLLLCVPDLLVEHRYEHNYRIVSEVTQISYGNYGAMIRGEPFFTVEGQPDWLSKLVPVLEVLK